MKETKIGLLAQLTKQQTDRVYFSNIPVGTKFIIVAEMDTPAYDLTGYFIKYPPQNTGGEFHFTGYIERGSWEIIGTIKDNIHFLQS